MPIPTSKTARYEQRLVLLVVVGFILLNEPMLSVYSKAASIGGVPVLYASLFLVWACLIAIVAWGVRSGSTLDAPPSDAAVPEASPEGPFEAAPSPDARH